MSSTWGNAIKISIFGQSHSNSIGVNIDSPPPGEKLNFDEIALHMKRRAPGNSKYSTSRKENDLPEIVCGFLNGVTTGTPLCAIIKNTDKSSSDYKDILLGIRPGHADYTGYIKYKGHTDIRGGGHFSGRLTAPLNFAGSVCRQILKRRGIQICAHVYSIGVASDTPFNPTEIPENLIKRLNNESFSTINQDSKTHMQNEIDFAKKLNDSIGGIIECAVIGINPGVGSPMFDGIENKISSITFGVPGVKGIEFGAGFSVNNMYASQNNDPFFIEDNKIKTITNNHGGILGGISSGMPIIFRVCIKPTPSISKEQNTINVLTNEETKIALHGRHDPCIVPRAVPVVESCAAIAVLDLIMSS